MDFSVIFSLTNILHLYGGTVLLISVLSSIQSTTSVSLGAVWIIIPSGCPNEAIEKKLEEVLPPDRVVLLHVLNEFVSVVDDHGYCFNCSCPGFIHEFAHLLTIFFQHKESDYDKI